MFLLDKERLKLAEKEKGIVEHPRAQGKSESDESMVS